MRIVVTGAGGFVGRRLCAMFSARGHAVFAVVHPDSLAEAKRLLPNVETVLPIDLAQLDVARLPAHADAVVTLGQARHFREFPQKAEEIFSVNVAANLKILHWAMNAGVRHVVHASSGGVYGGSHGVPFRETDLLAVDSPLGFYLGTKLCAEILLQNYRQFFEGIAILRPFFIYGPGQRCDMFVARLIDSIRNGRPVRLQGRNGLRVNPVFVDDAVSAFARALDFRGCSIFNVAGPEVVTLRQLCELIGAKLGRAPVYEVDEAATPVDYVGIATHAEQELGLATTPLERGIALAIQS